MTPPEPAKFTPKKGQFARVRGVAQFYNLYCAACGSHILLYQKDGIGTFKRLYLDRIFAPAQLAAWQSFGAISAVPNLTCPQCQALIGVPMIYRPENRFAVRLVPGAFSKRKSDGLLT